MGYIVKLIPKKFKTGGNPYTKYGSIIIEPHLNNVKWTKKRAKQEAIFHQKNAKYGSKKTDADLIYRYRVIKRGKK